MGFWKDEKGPHDMFYFIAFSFHVVWKSWSWTNILVIDLCIELCAVCDNVNSTALWLMGRIEKSKKRTWPHQHHVNTVKGIELNTECMYEILFWIGSEIHWFLYLWHVWRPVEIEKDELNKITGTFEWTIHQHHIYSNETELMEMKQVLFIKLFKFNFCSNSNRNLDRPQENSRKIYHTLVNVTFTPN